MSRLRLPAFLAAPLRPVFGSAAETRSAKIWAKRSARASNGCEERLGIGLNYSVSGCIARGTDAPCLRLVHKLQNAVDGRSVLGLEGDTASHGPRQAKFRRICYVQLSCHRI